MKKQKKINRITLKSGVYAQFSVIAVLFLSGCGLFETTGIKGRSSGSLSAVSYSSLPGWYDDDQRYALQAFKNSCNGKMQYVGDVVPNERLFNEKCRNLPSANSSKEVVRAWFESNFQPYKINDGTKGKFTGYYSPVVKACRYRTEACSAPIMNKPTDGTTYKGVDSVTLVKNRIGNVIYWIDPIDLQDMGSATLILEDNTRVKVSVASTNDLPFNGIGSQLLARGIRPPEGYGMKSVRAYLKSHRDLANELIANNPRYVYYAPSQTDAVTGTMGVPLSKIRSIAVDKSIYTLGMPMYLDTKLSDGKAFRRLMVAQDTGGAIIGYNRADIYFGVGDEAFEFAHGQNQPGQMYVLMPK
jgi:membrane-bound lytic murein transglycosylase A